MSVMTRLLLATVLTVTGSVVMTDEGRGANRDVSEAVRGGGAAQRALSFRSSYGAM
jgi:hypothetical protein